MEIIKMTGDQVPQVAALEKNCFSDPWSEKSVREELQNPLSLWLTAMEGERLAGYAGSQTVMGETDMMNVAVDPDFRRQGVGEKLILSLVEQLKESGNTKKHNLLRLLLGTLTQRSHTYRRKEACIPPGTYPKLFLLTAGL